MSNVQSVPAMRLGQGPGFQEFFKLAQAHCTKTRFVKLVLPLEETMVIKEEMVFKEEKVIKVEILEPNTGEMKSFDASTQTPPRNPRRRGGQGSRTKRDGGEG